MSVASLLQPQDAFAKKSAMASDSYSMESMSSASGLVGFLYEDDPSLQSFALQSLNEGMETFWPEVSASIPQM